MKKLIYIFLLLSAVVTGQNDALFEKGKDFYKAENYTAAIEQWNKIIASGAHSDALYFNLGNAHYKLNNIGPSIYYYEKALQLAPNDKDIQTNLAFAQNARIDVITPLPQTVLTQWYNAVATSFTYNGWAVMAVVFIILFVLFFLMYYFGFREAFKRTFFATALVSIFIAIFAFSLAYITYADAQNDSPAIIFSETIEIKTAPKLNSDTAFVLHEGTKVQVEAEDGDWFKISLADGKDGWIPKTDLKKL